jgi:hypothetical protein
MKLEIIALLVDAVEALAASYQGVECIRSWAKISSLVTILRLPSLKKKLVLNLEKYMH